MYITLLHVLVYIISTCTLRQLHLCKLYTTLLHVHNIHNTTTCRSAHYHCYMHVYMYITLLHGHIHNTTTCTRPSFIKFDRRDVHDYYAVPIDNLIPRRGRTNSPQMKRYLHIH